MGRRAAGMYIGDFGGRIWRFARANWGKVGALWYDTGDWLDGVGVVEVDGADRGWNWSVCGWP